MKKIAILSFGILMVFSSCNKDGDEQPINNNPNDFKDMVVQDNFNW